MSYGIKLKGGQCWAGNQGRFGLSRKKNAKVFETIEEAKEELKFWHKRYPSMIKVYVVEKI